MSPEILSNEKFNQEIKIVEEVKLKKIEALVSAAFYVGFLAKAEGRTIENEDNAIEIQNLINLIMKDIRV